MGRIIPFAPYARLSYVESFNCCRLEWSILHRVRDLHVYYTGGGCFVVDRETKLCMQTLHHFVGMSRALFILGLWCGIAMTVVCIVGFCMSPML